MCIYTTCECDIKQNIWFVVVAKGRGQWVWSRRTRQK